jgi:hypothetical protein
MLLFVAVLAAVSIIAGSAFAGAKHPKGDEDFAKSKAYKKLDLRLAESWRSYAKGGADPDRMLECLVKVKQRPTDAQRAALQAAGFDYRTVVGSIVTGNLKARSVPEVARLDFVEAMEQAVPLNLKSPGRGQAPTPYK